MMNKNSQYNQKKTLGPIVKVTKRLNLQTIKSTENKFQMVMNTYDAQQIITEKHLGNIYFGEINKSLNDRLDFDLNKAIQLAENSPGRQGVYFPKGIRSLSKNSLENSPTKVHVTPKANKLVQKYAFPQKLVSQNEYGFQKQENIKIHCLPLLNNSAQIRPSSSQRCFTPVRPLSSMQFANKDLYLYDTGDGDLTPEQWMQKCYLAKPPHAQCPIFQKGEYLWVDVKVLEWNEDKKKFKVQILETGTTKTIQRLSVRFKWQDNEAFNKRLNECRKRQKIAEEEIRFMNYVDSIPDKNVSLLPNQSRIKKRVRIKPQQLRNYVVKDLIVTLFQESAKLYERMMKKCYVLRDMEDSSNWMKFRDLRINIRQAPTFFSQYVDGLQTFDLQPLKRTMQDTFISTKQQVIQMLKQFSSKCEKFESYYLVDCGGSKQNYPVHVDEFDTIICGLQFRDQEVLQKQWRDYLISEVQDSLREVYRFYLPYVGQYIGSELHRLVTRVEFMYAQRLYSMLLRSLQKYTEFLQGFCLEFERPYHVQTNGLFSVTIQINTLKNVRKTSKIKNVTTLKKNILLENDQVDEDTEDMIYLDPPLTRIKETLMRPYQLMVEGIKACQRLEKDLVPLIKRTSREALEIEGKVIDPYMEKGLHHMVDEFNKAQGLAKEFRKFSYLLSPSSTSSKTISEILGAELKDNPLIGTLNLDRINSVLNRLQKAVLDIKGLCPDEIVTGLFKIKTSQAKDMLVLKAYENLQNILQKCSEIVKLNLKVVSQQYQDMFDRTTTIPANEKELIELKVFVDEKDLILKRLQSETSVIRNYLNLFEEKYFAFDLKMIEEYYLLKQWPEEVKHSIKEGAKIMQQQETKFMENLEQEKESFSRTFLKISEQFNIVRMFDKYSKTKEYTAEVLNLNETFNDAMQQIKSFNEREALFKLPISQYDDLLLLQKDFKPYKDLWNLASEFDMEKHVIMNGAFTKLSSITIQKKISSFIHESMKLSKTFQDLAEDCAAVVTREFRRDLDLLREKIWVVELLTIEAFVKKPSHWKELFRECKMIEIEPNEEMTLALLIQRGILEMRENVEEISRKADKQWNLEKKLNEMLDKMRDVKIEVQPFKGSGTYIFKSVDEVQQVLDEQLNVLMMMKASPYIRGCMSKAFQLEYKIVLIQDTIEGGIKCQRTWMYLEPIFSSEDIKKKLALEKQKFDNVDKNWRNQIEIFHKEPYLWDAIESDKIKNEFESCNKLLDQIQKSLSEYLESKRRFFPRFYFLSDEELLEILAQTKDPSTVQKHIGKCFEAINFLQFNAKQEVLAIMSQEREQINLIRPVDVNEGDKKGNIERWLSEIEIVMQDTVRHLCNQTFKDLETHRVEWVLKWPAQCILAINLIRWTRNAENAILGWGVGGQKWDLKLFFKQLNEQLVQTVDMVRRNLTPLQRITLGSLVVIDVHAKDIIHTLMVEDCRSITEFKWISQLRYYWVERVDSKTVDGIPPEKEPPKTTEINILVKMVNAEIGYRFEYLGNTNRLVITPLTDRCYRTLIGALHLNFGGAPEGPAGTGKTETVKDLAKAIAVQCVVFNCSDGLNYLAMSKFFKGLASSGAWCSFDEFNRIDAEVLSVIAQQIFTIQTAIKEKKKTFLFDGDEITLVPSCAINITMNPGYAGRSELPDNLKILFRPCAMMVPDYAMIAEIYLYSVGYQRARELSKKIVASMRLCTEQLSPQDHYDFGMRALKAILTCAGNLKRTHNQSEDVICLRALMNVNLPKFTVMDTPLFISITNDLFPDVHLPEQDYTNLKRQLVQTCQDNNLQPEQSFLEKCFQLAETLNVRHGLMCVGTAFSGKSKVIDSLAKACTALKDTCNEYNGVSIQKLNPKAITSDQLYGKLDSDTKQWSDGVAAIILRDSMKDESTEHKWILFDGPVDAVWIENLNTVLDDNKKLCLTSGEIIKLNSYISILFEVQDLASASPATVSRCGMVFFEFEQLGWYALVKSFSKYIPQKLEEQKEDIINKLKNIIDQSLGWTYKYGKYPIHNCQMTQVQTLLKYLSGLLKPFEEEEIHKINGPVDEIISQSILFATVWSIGAAIDENTRKGFNEFLQKLSLGQPQLIATYGLELNHPIESVHIPNKGFYQKFLFDLLYDPIKNQWEQWTETQNEFKVPTNIPYHKLLIPTNDSIRNDFFLNFSVKNKLHLLLSGQTGTGKTVNIVNQLNTFYFNSTYTNLQTAFSGQTTANQIQKTIEAKVCVRRRKGFFGPEDGKSHIVVFIDDLNMPAKEKYGAQPPIELLRQWMDYNGWYDLETKEFKCLQDINFVAAMLPPGGGRNSISMRYMRHYALLYVPPFDNESLKRIFSCVLQWFIQSQQPPLPKTVIQMDEQIVRSTIWIYEQVQSVKELLPTPAKAHYIYNLRDISKIFLGLSRGCSVSLVNQASFIKLWSHECMRIFSDRMITIEDQTVFEKLLQKIIQKEWGKDLSQSFQSNSIWASFVPSLHPDTRRTVTDIYNEVKNFNTLKERCQEYIDEHNILYVQNRMTLVFFLNAIQHVARIVRIIQTTFGHALLIGMGGTGRSSLARLSSFIATQNQPHTLDQRNWIEELQKLLRIVGIDGKLTTVLFHDTQIIKETMVEEVCNLLNNGEVPNLFPQEDRLKIIEEVQGAPQTASPNEKYQHFVQKCKLNLHMVICMQPVGEPFRRRLRNFPALVNCTTIDWFQSWPEEALTSTASSFFLQHFEYETDGETRDGLVKVAVDVHSKVQQATIDYYQELRRFFYVTPTQYLQLLSTFQRLYARQKEIVRIQIDRYETGVDKIVATEKDVDAMRQVLFDLQPKLEKSTQENLELLRNLQIKQEEADQKKQFCEQEERECNSKRLEANNLRNDCQTQLDNVLPLLAQAAEALDKITKDDMTQLKSFTNPPPSAAVVMEGLCYAFSEDVNVKGKDKQPPSNQDFWDYAKKSLLNDKLIRKVKDFKIEQIRAIPTTKIAKLKLFSENPLFEKDKVMNASKAAGNLSLWIRSVLETYEALMIIEPKKAQLAEAEIKLKQAEEAVIVKQRALEEVLKLLAGLQQEYNIAKKEKEDIEAQVAVCQAQLSRAEKLTNGLSHEKLSWLKKSGEFHGQQKCIFGDCLLASAIISYLGVFPVAYREMCINNWKERLTLMGIKYSQNFSLQHMLSDPITIGYWTNQEKLPNESFSIDNAIILKNSTRWPLMIDPQMQANTWIKCMENQRNLLVLRPTQSAHELQFQLENAIAIGYPVLLENIGQSIDQLFEPVLQQKMVRQGNSMKLRMGDKVIDYSNDFKFYMTTKLNNPHYAPQVCVMVTMLNFMVTLEGLEDQMLNIVVKMDEPAKEEQRIRNIKEFFENKNKQKATEDQILKLLYEAKGDLLNDEVLINTLGKSKIESQEIEERLKKQEHDREIFNQIRSNYRDVARRVANLYFVILDLSLVEPTYYWSLEFYILLYEKSIKESSHSKDHRSRNIIEKFQMLLYNTVCRSLLEKDKFLFSFLLTLKVMQSENRLSTQHIRFCVLGTTLSEPTRLQPQLPWITKKMWCGLCELSERFPQLFGWVIISFNSNLQFWDMFYNNNSPQELEIPVKLPDNFNLFHRSILIKLIRPDKFIRIASQIITQELGKQYLEPPAFNLEQLFKESDNLTPLIFILSTGADPRHEIQSLAEKLNFTSRFVQVSLGQGQGELAEKEIKSGAQLGKWILLQNCHVAHSFMPHLEVIYEHLAHMELSKEFRLWLTSMPSSLFPHSLLLKGIKMTYEPPRGLRNNLLRSYVAIDPVDFEDCKKSKEWKALLFSLSFFHAILLERRKYGPLGWNVPYAFTSADLEISKLQLKMFLDKYSEIPWDALHYLVASTNYGGRVTDPQDRRLIDVILKDYYSQEILEDKHKFGGSNVYYVPPDGPLDSYLNFIKNLPYNDPPSIFGLHPNAEIYSAILESNLLSSVVLSLLPRTTVTGSKAGTPDQQVKQRSTNILDKLPNQFDVREVGKKYPLLSNESLNTVLQQELIRYNKLINIVHITLNDLMKAIDGLVIMSPELEELYNRVFDNQVPEAWKKFSYPSLKPLGSWMTDLLDRLGFLQKWIDNGIPSIFWISGFFFTQSFLTGVLQNYSRKHKIAIDRLHFSFYILDVFKGENNEATVDSLNLKLDLTKAQSDGCVIYGLFLDGARWSIDKKILIEPETNVLFYQVPFIWLLPTHEEKLPQPDVLYECPVYKTSIRQGSLGTSGHSTNYIISIDVPISADQTYTHWIKRSVAMLTQLDE